MPKSLAPAPAHSPEAERATIGALLLDPHRIIDIAPVLTPQDFYDPTYRTIYGAIARLYEARKPIDFVTVADELSVNQKVQEIGGSAFLAELCSSVATSSHAPHYVAIVREKAVHRQLQNVGFEIQALAADEKLPATEALE